MAEQTHIADMVIPDIDTIRPDDPVRLARRRMESQTRRSLIVVDGDQPVGIVQWRDIMREDSADAEAPVRDHMVSEIPLLTTSMRVDEARDKLSGVDVDVDRLPVVDENGRLVGEVPRSAVAHYGESVETVDATDTGTSAGRETIPVANGETVEERGATGNDATATVESGMTVVGTGDKKLGSVDQIIVDPAGRLAAFTVAHGLFGRKHKRIPADLVDHVDSDNIIVTIGSTEFNMLPDVEDQQ